MYVLSGLGYFVIFILNITFQLKNNNQLLNSQNKNSSLFFTFQLLYAVLFFMVWGILRWIWMGGECIMSVNERSLITLLGWLIIRNYQ